MKKIVTAAMERVAEEDDDLLKLDVNKRSITHRLGMYLHDEVREPWDVDVEYNQVGKDDYVIKQLPKEVLDRENSKKVYPDVVIHQRGSEEDNLLVIEAKKSGARMLMIGRRYEPT